MENAPESPEPQEPKIYLLPNLMTAGNLFCGFFAVLQVFRGMVDADTQYAHYNTAILLILGACIFDLLDGRLARLGGQDSPFGREFDSIADIISFGVAPALLLYDIVLRGLPEQSGGSLPQGVGWFIACIYLLCGAMRLARFNCLAAQPGKPATSDFVGLPIPMAAGTIASLTLCMLWIDEGNKEIGAWKYALPPLMILLSFMMMSKVKYPSFKGVSWRTKRSMTWVFAAALILVLAVLFYQVVPALLFVAYLLYGVIRPWLSRRWRKEIEEVLEPEDDPNDVGI